MQVTLSGCVGYKGEAPILSSPTITGTFNSDVVVLSETLDYTFSLIQGSTLVELSYVGPPIPVASDLSNQPRRTVRYLNTVLDYLGSAYCPLARLSGAP